MQTQNKFLDDIAKLAANAAGTLNDVKSEAEAAFKARIERIVADHDLVTREEVEVVKAMAEKAREENEALKARIEALETAFGEKTAE